MVNSSLKLNLFSNAVYPFDSLLLNLYNIIAWENEQKNIVIAGNNSIKFVVIIGKSINMLPNLCNYAKSRGVPTTLAHPIRKSLRI